MNQEQLSERLWDLAARIGNVVDALPDTKLRETRSWVRFIIKVYLLPEHKLATVRDECEQLCRMVGKSVLTPGFQDSHFRGLDHVAIVVPNSDEALKIWRDRLGFNLPFTEVINSESVRLTHLDLGDAHLQLAELLTSDHPLQEWLRKNGPGLHHFCAKFAEINSAARELGNAGMTCTSPHEGTGGKRATFVDTTRTHGVQMELTGA